MVLDIHVVASLAEPEILDCRELPNDKIEPKIVKLELPVTGLLWPS
jgi:hypothetical protein